MAGLNVYDIWLLGSSYCACVDETLAVFRPGPVWLFRYITPRIRAAIRPKPPGRKQPGPSPRDSPVGGKGGALATGTRNRRSSWRRFSVLCFVPQDGGLVGLGKREARRGQPAARLVSRRTTRPWMRRRRRMTRRSSPRRMPVEQRLGVGMGRVHSVASEDIPGISGNVRQ